MYQSTPHQSTPHQSTPHQSTPHQSTPHQSTPHQSTPHQSTPHQSIPYQPNPSDPPRKILPTMYDLPSEDPEEPGLPDEFHDIQPQLLRETFCSPTYPPEQVFCGTDLNVYYDLRHPRWYKRPDWFVVLGVEASQNQQELRLSYVMWQEGVAPFLVVELLSPGTEDEDLGRSLRDIDQPPTKWNVYERILHVPYYAVFSRYTGELQVFEIKGVRYQKLALEQNRVWLPEVELGLGVWQGAYIGVEGRWLRWYDAQGNWLPLAQERAEQERERAEQEKERAEQEKERAEQVEQQLEAERSRSQQLLERLRSLGVAPEDL
jgi:Uma2 family endonuclease